jgi:hypothetical protein
MEIKLICENNDVTSSIAVKVDNLTTEENLKKVLVSFIKFLNASGATFPEELLDIMEEYSDDFY